MKWYDIGKKYRVVIPIIVSNSNSGRPQIEHNCLVHVSVICTPVAGYEPSAIQETSVLALTMDVQCFSPVVEEVYLAPEYICRFFLDSLSTDSSDFKSAGCQVGNFGQFDI